MINKDIVMLVIASRSDIYDQMINKYWCYLIKYIKENNYSIKIYLIFGNNVKTDDLNLNDDDKLILNTPESYMPGILIKTIESFKIINNLYDYKHIIRTNLSSFFIVNNILKISAKLNDNNIYTGIEGTHTQDNKKIIFISGAGYWLSRDNINYILNNKNNLNINLIDDVSIGDLLSNINKSKLDRYDLTNGIEISDKKKLLEDIIKKEHYHIRINSINKNLDINYINSFTEILYKDKIIR